MILIIAAVLGIELANPQIGVAYQAHSGNRPGEGPIGFADALAGGDRRPNSNTDNRFPWAPVAGGTHRAKRTDSYKALWLPRNGRKPYPVVFYRHGIEGLESPSETVTGYNWTFPTGAVVWEMLTAEYDGEVYCYEVRSRWRYSDHWRPRVYRPFPKASDAAAAVLTHPRTRLGAAFIEACYAPVPATARIQSREQGNPAFGTGPGDAFDLEFGVDEIPPLPPGLVAEMLDTTPFREVEGLSWKPGCSSPISRQPFHIVPEDGLLAIVGGDEESCARCHNTSLTSSRRFGINQRWGWVRGNLGEDAAGGGIISWHPIAPAVFWGRERANPNVRLRTKWIATGLVRHFNRGKHRARYSRLVPEHLRGEP